MSVKIISPQSGLVGTWNNSLAYPSNKNLNFSCVNDYPGVDDDDYCYITNRVSHWADTYDLNSNENNSFNIPRGSTNISVKIYLRGNFSGAESNRLGGFLGLGSGATHYGLYSSWAGTGFEDKEYTWATNPGSGSAWTVNEINGTGGTYFINTFGYEDNGDNVNERDSEVSRIYIEVTFDPPAPIAQSYII